VSSSESSRGPAEDAVPVISDGLFFTRPPGLPRGRHLLDRGRVLDAQRERLMIAVTELAAGEGFSSVGVGEIARRARVSRAAFYQCFGSKDDCIFAAYDRFISVLVDRLVAASEGGETWEDTLESVLHAYLGTLADDLVVARAFQVEMDALGRRARAQRRSALSGLADLLKSRRDLLWPGAEQVPVEAYVGAVYVVRQMASDRLDEVAAPDLLGLIDDVAATVTAMVSGAESLAGG
jgi:AcrR family transcriptional regulator